MACARRFKARYRDEMKIILASREQGFERHHFLFFVMVGLILFEVGLHYLKKLEPAPARPAPRTNTAQMVVHIVTNMQENVSRMTNPPAETKTNTNVVVTAPAPRPMIQPQVRRPVARTGGSGGSPSQGSTGSSKQQQVQGGKPGYVPATNSGPGAPPANAIRVALP